jgi:hypothetical protein
MSEGASASAQKTRPFLPPWTVEQVPGGYKDATGQSLAYVYGRELLIAFLCRIWLPRPVPRNVMKPMGVARAHAHLIRQVLRQLIDPGLASRLSQCTWRRERSPGGMPGPTTPKSRDYDIRLFERLRHHRLLVMPEASSKSDRCHRDDDGQSEKCSHC